MVSEYYGSGITFSWKIVRNKVGFKLFLRGMFLNTTLKMKLFLLPSLFFDFNFLKFSCCRFCFLRSMFFMCHAMLLRGVFSVAADASLGDKKSERVRAVPVEVRNDDGEEQCYLCDS